MKGSSRILEALQATFPSTLWEDVALVSSVFSDRDSISSVGSGPAFKVATGQIDIPNRTYFSTPSQEVIREFSKAQAAILGCLMTRHHSGFVREAGAMLLSACPEIWTAPFAAMLLSDYVFEVAVQLEKMLTPQWISALQEFTAANPEFGKWLAPRIVANWNDDYRGVFPKFRDYPIYKTAKLLGLWEPSTAPRLTKERIANRGA